jgi:hypothetical protein
MAGYISGSIYGIVGFNQATLPTGSGMVLGHSTIIYDAANKGFREVMLVQAGGALTANQALKFSAAGTVVPTAAAGDIVQGVNDLSGAAMGTGAAVANGNYFYMTIRGCCNPLVAAGQAAGTKLMASGTAGQLTAWTSAQFANTNLASLAASGAGGATLCWLQ